MAFEDPSKLKIDLVVEPEIGNQEPTTEYVAIPPAQEPAALPKVPSTDGSLTPWKNRFANSTQKDSTLSTWQGRAKSIAFKIVDRGTVGLSILTIVTGLAALGVVTYGNNPTSYMAPDVFLVAPCVVGFVLYPLFIVRMLMMINSLRQPKRYTAFLRAVVPAIVTNTMTTWGFMLALAAFVVAKGFVFVKSLESSIGQQHMGQAMAVLALASAGLMQVLLVSLIIFSMVLFQKLFQWMEKRTLELSGVAFGEKKAGLWGVTTGAITGLCGLYTALSAGGERPVLAFSISTLIWSIGILLASLFFSRLNKLLQNKT